jgi:pimeloyl-ACP methyl ester carboxylesterase
MPFVQLEQSPHAPGISPVAIHYRDIGRSRPLVFLHGGWGYGVYPIRRQIEALQDQLRILIPDRSGHGHSPHFAGPLPTDFHRRAAEETLLILDELRIERTVLWGHSDGAVIAALIGLMAPGRCEHLILEAFHFYRRKPKSHEIFFQRFANHPDEVSEKMQNLLAEDHGAEHWRSVVQRNCRVWLELDAQSTRLDEDLYNGCLSELHVPVTFIHGRHDPRTEPGEIDKALRSIPHADLRFIENGRHSPHSESAAAQEFTEILSGRLSSK